jgi:tRNA(Arg) A34 adenosine deaminase TadA
MEQIINLSKKTEPVFRSKHAAGLYYKTRLLATGVNRLKTHPMMLRYSKHPDCVNLHAEIDCIVKVINRYGTSILKECTLYVARTYQSGATANSKPCDGCTRAIRAFGIPKTFYTTKEGWRPL